MKGDVGLKIEIRDDRGSQRSVYGRANEECDIWRSSRRGGEVYRETVHTSWANAGWMILITAVVCAIGYGMRFAFPAQRGSVVAMIVCWIIATVVMRVTHVNWARKRVFQRKVREIVAMGKCPACEYSIAERPVEADGCVVCTECGGAWRVKSAGEEGRGES